MIRTIIFDIGNVLAGFVWKPYFAQFGYSKEVLERIAKATVESDVWDSFDRGAMTDEELMEAFIGNDPGIERELRESLTNISGMLTKYEYAVPWVRELKAKGYQVLVLSNFSHKAYRDCQDVLEFLDDVDGGILSFRDKVVKPEPEIYQLLIDRYQLIPQECVFLDDTPKNLVAAEAFGIHTIHFTDREKAITELKKLGVE